MQTSASAERSSAEPSGFYAERGSPKHEKAAKRWLERYLNEGTPRLQRFAEIPRVSPSATLIDGLRIEERELEAVN